MLAAEYMMNSVPATNTTHNGFFLGLITGGVIGAILAIALAPKLAAELRQRVTTAAGDAADAATRTYRDASIRVVGAVDEVTARGQAVRDDVADAVGRGARTVEQYAMASKSDPKRA
jgi:gas vesicle protein